MSRILTIIGVVLDDTTLWITGQKKDSGKPSSPFEAYQMALCSLHSSLLDVFIGSRSSSATVQAIVSIIRAGAETWTSAEVKSEVREDAPELEGLLLSTLTVTLNLLRWNQMASPGIFSLLERTLVDIESKAIPALARMLVSETLDERVRTLSARILTALLQTVAAHPIGSVGGSVSFVACLGDYTDTFAASIVKLLEDPDEDKRLQFEVWRFLEGCIQDQVGLAAVFLKVEKTTGDQSQFQLVALIKEMVQNWKYSLEKGVATFAAALSFVASLWLEYPAVVLELREDNSFWESLLGPLYEVEAIITSFRIGTAFINRQVVFFVIICAQVFAILASEVFAAERTASLKRDLRAKNNLRRSPVQRLLEGMVTGGNPIKSWFSYLIRFPYDPLAVINLKQEAGSDRNAINLDAFIRPGYQQGSDIEWDIEISYAYDTGLMHHKLNGRKDLIRKCRLVNENLALTDASGKTVKWWGKLVQVLAFASDFKGKEWNTAGLTQNVHDAMIVPSSGDDTSESVRNIQARMSIGHNTALAEVLSALAPRADPVKFLPQLSKLAVPLAFSTDRTSQNLRLHLLGSLLETFKQVPKLELQLREKVISDSIATFRAIVKKLARGLPSLRNFESKVAVLETVLLATIFTEVVSAADEGVFSTILFEDIANEGILQLCVDLLTTEHIVQQQFRPNIVVGISRPSM
ncbi:hypothetical protein HDU93_009846 [Gonapodya sp. JEL0774]|nr:hypothetical protein HDU93_009846 [Gonapodya sp. JEL0774]